MYYTLLSYRGTIVVLQDTFFIDRMYLDLSLKSQAASIKGWHLHMVHVGI